MAPHRGGPDPARRRLPLEPVRLDGRRPLDADRARLRLDVPDLAPDAAAGAGNGATHRARSSGREAIRRELRERTSRWQLTGLVIDWRDYDRIYDDAGLIPPKDHTPIQDEYYVYDDALNQLGYATSQMYSPMLQRHIALARVPLEPPAPRARASSWRLGVRHRYEYFDAHGGEACPCSTHREGRPDDGEDQRLEGDRCARRATTGRTTRSSSAAATTG